MIISYITFIPFSFEAGVILAIILLLLFVSGFCSASETAFFSLSPVELEKVENEENNPLSQKIASLKNAPEKLLAAILIANNFANVAIAVLSAIFIEKIIDFGNAKIVEFIVQTVVITFVLLLCGEIMPKMFASQNALKMCQISARPLSVLQTIFKPFVSILVKSTSLINRRLAKNHYNNLSINELSQALDLTENIEQEQELLRGIVQFGNLSVDNIMTSRPDVVALDIKTPFNQVITKIIETGYSRIPTYEKTLDNIKGVLYIKDLIPHLNKNSTFRWQTLVRPATFVPETRKIDDLLQDFQRLKVHIAVVVDEFGGTLGIVTMEDVLEEIVGDISDEYDNEEKLYTKINNNTYEFEAKILLNDFFKITGINTEIFKDLTSDVDTLAGLILELFKELPHVSEHISRENYTFTILAMDKRRIKKVKVEIEN
ncbi:MAG: gliding motility-associated protein GldE [Prevotellaceae bacterium]|nr:gliding motility-associated protein GldE [Prevotellaceae bacterium]